VHVPNAKPGIWISRVSIADAAPDIPTSVEVHFHSTSSPQDIYTDLESIALTHETPRQGTDHLPWTLIGTFGVDAGGVGILARSAFLPGGVCFRFAERDSEVHTQILFETVGLAATDRGSTHAAVPGGIVCACARLSYLQFGLIL
jgi:hypothetical protein